MEKQPKTNSLQSSVESAFAAFKDGDKEKFELYYRNAMKLIADGWKSLDKNDRFEPISANDWLGEAKDLLDGKNRDKTETREDIIGFYYEWLTDEDWHNHTNK